MSIKDNLRARARTLKARLPAVYIALRDPQTPWTARVVAAITVGYALSPIDLIPDFIPVLGALDDLLLLPALVALTMRLIPAEVWARSEARAGDLWQGGRPKQWRYAIPVVVIWVLVVIWVARMVLGTK